MYIYSCIYNIYYNNFILYMPSVYITLYIHIAIYFPCTTFLVANVCFTCSYVTNVSAISANKIMETQAEENDDGNAGSIRVCWAFNINSCVWTMSTVDVRILQLG